MIDEQILMIDVQMLMIDVQILMIDEQTGTEQTWRRLCLLHLQHSLPPFCKSGRRCSWQSCNSAFSAGAAACSAAILQLCCLLCCNPPVDPVAWSGCWVLILNVLLN